MAGATGKWDEITDRFTNAGEQFTKNLITAGNLSAFPPGEPSGIKTIDIAGGAIRGAAAVMGIKPGSAVPPEWTPRKEVTQSPAERTFTGEGLAGPGYTPVYTGPAAPVALAGLPTENPITYTLPGTEGSMTVGPQRFFDKAGNELPAGANVDIADVVSGVKSGDELARQRILNEAGSGIPSETTGGIPKPAVGGNVIRTWTGGEQSLAQKEEAQWGPGGAPVHPGEFDYAKFKAGVSSLGIPIDAKTMINLYGTALKAHEEKVNQYNDLVKAQKQYGAGSPAMMNAQSEATYRDTLARIANAKSLPEVQGILANTEKTKAETGGIPTAIAHTEAQTGLLKEQTRLEKYAPVQKQHQAELKSLENEIMSPEARMIAKEKIDQKYAPIYEGMQKADQIRASFPNWTVPDRIEIGKIYSFIPGKRFRVRPDWTFELVK